MIIFELIDFNKAIEIVSSNTDKLNTARLKSLKAIDGEFYNTWMMHLKPILTNHLRSDVKALTPEPMLDFALPAWGAIREATVNIIIDTLELYLMLMYNVDAKDKHIYQQVIDLIAQACTRKSLLRKTLRLMDSSNVTQVTISERVFYHLYFTSNSNMFK